MCAYTSVKYFTDCLIYRTLRNGEVINYHIFISAVVIELSVRCLNTGPEDRLTLSLCINSRNPLNSSYLPEILFFVD